MRTLNRAKKKKQQFRNDTSTSRNTRTVTRSTTTFHNFILNHVYCTFICDVLYVFIKIFFTKKKQVQHHLHHIIVANRTSLNFFFFVERSFRSLFLLRSLKAHKLRIPFDKTNKQNKLRMARRVWHFLDVLQLKESDSRTLVKLIN